MRAAAVAPFILFPAPAGAGFPPVIDLAQTPANVTILGAAAYEHAGARSTCGDYNGDGLLDFVILSMGRVTSDGYAFFHIFWGGAPLSSTLDLAATTENVSCVRAMAGDDGRWARIGSGDFNGDGLDDIALGVPCTRFNCAGKVYVLFGAHDFPDTLDLQSPTIGMLTVYGAPGGPSFGGFMGYALAAGDVNGDAMDELVIGAPEFGLGGHVYILWGRHTWLPTVDVGSSVAPVTRLIDTRHDHNSGMSLACGDANGDGLADILIGGGDVMLALGAAAWQDTVLLSGSTVKRFYRQGSGVGARGIADFDDDGYDDIIMASPYASPLGCEECGEVIVAYGGSAIPDMTLLSAPYIPVSFLLGNGVTQAYGARVAHGDVNGDGYQDIMISSQPDDVETSDVGKITIVYGAASRPDTVLLESDSDLTRVYAERRPDGFGYGLLSCDVDMDGLDDVIVGAYWADVTGRPAAGKAYVLYGQPNATGIGSRHKQAGRLGQNYPNPFNPVTVIPLSLREAGPITLRVYDIRGRIVRTLLDKNVERGDHAIPWDGMDDDGDPAASGVYFCRLAGPSFSEVRRMVLIR